jgi:hypothetical protein
MRRGDRAGNSPRGPRSFNRLNALPCSGSQLRGRRRNSRSLSCLRAAWAVHGSALRHSVAVHWMNVRGFWSIDRRVCCSRYPQLGGLAAAAFTGERANGSCCPRTATLKRSGIRKWKGGSGRTNRRAPVVGSEGCQCHAFVEGGVRAEATRRASRARHVVTVGGSTLSLAVRGSEDRAPWASNAVGSAHNRQGLRPNS